MLYYRVTIDEDSDMTEIVFFCTLCGQRNTGTERTYGASFTCSRCGASVIVPAKPSDDNALSNRRVEPDNTASRTTTPEVTIIEFAPSIKAHGCGVVFRAVLCLTAMIGIFWVWLMQESPWWHLLSLLCLIAGLFLLGRACAAVKTVQYRLTNQRLLMIAGLFARTTQELELFRVKDISVSQTLLARVLGYGTITVFSTDDSNLIVLLAGIGNPLGIKELIRDNYMEARRSLGLLATEFIQS